MEPVSESIDTWWWLECIWSKRSLYKNIYINSDASFDWYSFQKLNTKVIYFTYDEYYCLILVRAIRTFHLDRVQNRSRSLCIMTYLYILHVLFPQKKRWKFRWARSFSAIGLDDTSCHFQLGISLSFLPYSKRKENVPPFSFSRVAIIWNRPRCFPEQ